MIVVHALTVLAGEAAQDNTSTLILAGVISSVVASVAAYLTSKASAKSNQIVAETTTRGEIEQGAFEKAEKFLANTIDRQDREIRELADKVQAMDAQREADRQELQSAVEQLARYKRVGRRLARGVYEMRKQLQAMDIATPVDPDLEDAVLEFLGSTPN